MSLTDAEVTATREVIALNQGDVAAKAFDKGSPGTKARRVAHLEEGAAQIEDLDSVSPQVAAIIKAAQEAGRIKSGRYVGPFAGEAEDPRGDLNACC